MTCEFCDDGDGNCAFPHYGVAPHICFYQIPDAVIGESYFLPKEDWPINFEQDKDNPECGTYTHCLKCGDGERKLMKHGITALVSVMSEAPKKIWVEYEEGCWPTVIAREYEAGTQYIRADIVEEMREALETMIEAYRGEFGSHWGERLEEETEEHDEVIKARAALKRLEET